MFQKLDTIECDSWIDSARTTQIVWKEINLESEHQCSSTDFLQRSIFNCFSKEIKQKQRFQLRDISSFSLGIRL